MKKLIMCTHTAPRNYCIEMFRYRHVIYANINIPYNLNNSVILNCLNSIYKLLVIVIKLHFACALSYNYASLRLERVCW